VEIVSRRRQHQVVEGDGALHGVAEHGQIERGFGERRINSEVDMSVQKIVGRLLGDG
jgi:hypothetical protein